MNGLYTSRPRSSSFSSMTPPTHLDPSHDAATTTTTTPIKAKHLNINVGFDPSAVGINTNSIPISRRFPSIRSGAITSIIATFLFIVIIFATKTVNFITSTASPKQLLSHDAFSTIPTILSKSFLERRAFLKYSPSIHSHSSNSTTNYNSDNQSPSNLTTTTTTTNGMKHLTREEQDSRIISLLEQWKDSQFASQHLSIYVYQLPPEFNTALVERSHKKNLSLRDPFCDSNFYSSEVHVHRFLLNSSVRVMDPSKADLFYVPIYTTCDLINYLPNNIERVGGNFKKAVDYIRRHFPFYDQSNGRDHVFLFSQGFSARLAGNWSLYKNSIFMVHNGEFTAPEYTPHKDFTIPPYLTSYFNPVWTPPHDSSSPTSAGDMLDENENVDKIYLGQFGGQVIKSSIADHRGTNHSKGVRNFIVKRFRDDPDYRITGHRAETYVDDIKKSIFCFAPEGWHPWTPRPYYGILLGCIPVVISEIQEMAFEEFINWDSFVLWVKPKDIHNIDAILRSLPRAEVERRRQAMRRLWRVFWYGENGLAFQAILRTLYLRKLDNRPVRKFSTIYDFKLGNAGQTNSNKKG